MNIDATTENPMMLADLLADIVDMPSLANKAISGLAIDSRVVSEGYLFIAYPGLVTDGRQYIESAIAQGAVAILVEKENMDSALSFDVRDYPHVPILSLTDVQQYVGLIASRFYAAPSSQLTMIGVTGTNGKTSCSQFIAESLTMANTSCALIGTIGSGFPGNLQTASHTTPDPICLQKQFHEFLQQEAKAVAMEVSSHSLVQGRVVGTEFDIAVFTNFSRDHLDYHGSMENYWQAKRLLFQHPGLRYAVINIDDEYGRKLLSDLPDSVEAYAYSQQQSSTEINVPLITASDVKVHPKGVSAKVKTPWGEGVMRSQLLGRFNISNLLAVLTSIGILGVDLDETLKFIAKLATVAGRMQAFGGGKLPLVVVDYAHTPDALSKALQALREHCQGNLWCVFGCGGGRDRGKRALMAQVAERFSDQLVLTDDNPRMENPQSIIDDMLCGLLCSWAAEVEHDRGAAIAHAIDCAADNDVILIAGKGHEDYQEVGGERFSFNDANIVSQQLKARQRLTKPEVSE